MKYYRFICLAFEKNANNEPDHKQSQRNQCNHMDITETFDEIWNDGFVHIPDLPTELPIVDNPTYSD